MPRPTLHPVRLASHTLYWVEDYPLFIRKHDQGWGIHAAPSRIECKTWLAEHNLQGQRFHTRGEALDILLLALQIDGSPNQDMPPRAQRQKDGSYRTNTGWTFRAAPGGWDVYDPSGAFQKNSRGSLWRALWLVDILSAGAKDEDDWPPHLRHDRTERGIDEGVDRSPGRRVD